MKKVLMILLAAVFVTAVIASAGCLTQSSSVPITPTPEMTQTQVISPVQPTSVVIMPDETASDLSGEWYGLFNPSNSRFIEMSVDKDGKVDAIYWKIDKNGNREKIDVRKGTLTGKPDGTYVLAIYNDREQSSFTLIPGPALDVMAETAENGLVFFRNRDLAGLPANIKF
ncbi:MAG TPA: hypothetical protein O0X39_01930 [Methanocorpusculum sp.]|nr:hypothetical protein [Methanocorpusculum sp.]